MSLQHKSYFFFFYSESLWNDFIGGLFFARAALWGPHGWRYNVKEGFGLLSEGDGETNQFKSHQNGRLDQFLFYQSVFNVLNHVCLQIQLGCSSAVISHSTMWAPKTNFCQVFVKNSVLHYYLQHSFKLNEKHSFELNETPVNQMWLNSFQTRLNSHSKLGFSLLSLDVFFGNYYFLNSVYLVGTWLHSTLHPITT